ncbi:glucocorticoid-induced transcript 1 protein-like isoform X2 [Arctopsyche grandis]|uniref:glucocorticoid-induced transcript 1 protein-like isoform X2 n=1 Tax=Arctopsyche grandis TaxID=121162 RepID=UPI00406D841E
MAVAGAGRLSAPAPRRRPRAPLTPQPSKPHHHHHYHPLLHQHQHRRVLHSTSPSPSLSPSTSNFSYSGQIDVSLNTIRRTASLDAIYQKEPLRDCCDFHLGFLQVDKATQGKILHSTSSIVTTGSNVTAEDKFDKFLRHRLQRISPAYRLQSSNNAAEHASQTMSPVFFPGLRAGNGVPLRATRSSVEGLNQEIERLVLCPTPSHQLERNRDKITPEGHRAPLAELLRRSVNTQTPAHSDRQSQSAHSSGPPSRESLSSGCSPERHGMPGGSVCSSPDLDVNKLGTSPHINRFLAREPPDGCEKVNLKFTEGVMGCSKTIGDISPIKPSVGFQLRPSLGSAFQPLQPPSPLPASTQHSEDPQMTDNN